MQIIKDGNSLSRSYSLKGSEFALQTAFTKTDLTKELSEYEKLGQTLSPKIQKIENALSFLENPSYADVALSHMQEGLRKTLGYSQYEALNIKNITDKNELVSLLNSNVTDYKQELSQAKRGYENAINAAVSKNRQANEQADEKIKITLRALKNSGLDALDIDYLISNIKGGYITPEI